jgi:hypothetical protein
MEKIPQALEDKLQDYIDGRLQVKEVAVLEEQLKHDRALRNRLAELQQVHQLMKTLPLDEPSADFTTRIMQKIAQKPALIVHYSIRQGLVLLAGILVAAGLAVFLVDYGVFDQATSNYHVGPSGITKKYLPSGLDITFNSKLIVNIIVLLNLVLAWVILDRLILKPLFQKRLQNHG